MFDSAKSTGNFESSNLNGCFSPQRHPARRRHPPLGPSPEIMPIYNVFVYNVCIRQVYLYCQLTRMTASQLW
ncbi:hypothetical protein ACRALDRAFT_209874 [Sodiomyces alcalophilus JCM 7366]|uniref:uncharacterized protein n=1 Tax=Sodiomyces alcalophilus JCM 7366 TaxID=591952 RepID=UPI0039B5915C